MKKIFSKFIAIMLTLVVTFSTGLLLFSVYAETGTEKPLIELCDVNSKPFIPEEYDMAVSGLEGVPSYDSETGWKSAYAMTDESTFAHYFWVREFNAGDTVYVTVSSESAYNFLLLGIESGESIGTLTDGKVVFEITETGLYVLTMHSDSSDLTVKSHFNNIKEPKPNSSGRYVSGNFTYKILEDGTAELRDYSGGAVVTIPETLYGRKVTEIVGAFSSKSITSVTIPNTVKYIGGHAFWACKNLKSIELPDSVEYIGDGAFAYCDSLETFIIGSGLKKVHESAFDYYSLKQVYAIKEFIIDPDNPYFTSKDGVWYSKDMTTLVKYPYANERIVFEIPEGVETIAEYAFHRCQEIRKVVFPSTMKTVKSGAFDWAYKLSEVVLNDGLEVIEDSFARTDIRTLHLPESVTQATFWETKLRYVALPETYTGWASFWAHYDSFVSAYIPKGVSKIGCGAFEYSNGLTDIYFGGTQEEWENFIQCTCDPEVYDICDNPIITATVHYNHTHTLDRYYVVKAATPNSKGVADHACVCGYSMRKEYEYEPNSKIQGFCGHSLAWDFDFETGALKISGYGDMWDYWDITEFPWYGIKDYIKSIEFEEGITSISEYAFENCSNFSKLIIPESLVSIGANAFSGCSDIVELSLGNELETIGDYAFYGCTGIEKVDLHENITSIGENTFAGCSGMKEFCVGKNIKNFNLKFLEDFVVLEKLYVHPYCWDLITDDCGAVLKKNTPYVSQYWFCYYPPCAPYETYAVPESVYYIKSNAFNGNKNLKTIYFPKNLKTIYDSAFADCTGITDIYYCGTAEEANNITIEANNDCLYNATIHFEHTHTFTETAEKAATCSQDGYVKNICGECGYTETEVIPETGHTPTDWIYYARRVYHKSCSVCGLVLEKTSVSWETLNFKNRLELWRTQDYRFNPRVNDSTGKQFYVDFNITSSDENVVTVEIYERTGYIFLNAVGLGEATITITVDGTDISKVIGVTVVPTGNYAQWWVDGKRIDYDWVYEGEPIPVYEPPVKEGYEFVGWSPEVPETMPYDLDDDLEFHAVYNKVTKAENFDVSASYLPEAFDEEVSLDVAEIQGDREPGGVYMVEGEYYKQVGLYNIKAVNENSEVVQPNEGYKVTIRLAIPEAYKNQTSFMIYHRFTGGGREQLSTAAGTIKVENGYLVFEVSQFSEFELFVPAPSIKITQLPDKTV